MFFSRVYESWHKMQKRKYSILKKLNLSGRILDIGCGPFFKNSGIIGLDIDKNCRPTVIADGNELPFRENSFDTVISIDAIHLIKSKDFRRVLKPDGFALLSIFFNRQNYNEKRSMLRKKLNGFEIIDEFTIDDKESEYFVLARKDTDNLTSNSIC